jgi:glycosyltransferase involved in cell wall biosynthesis
MNPKILILTPTLGERESLAKTISSVKEIGGEQVKHILIAPHNQQNQLKEKYPDLTIMTEPADKQGIYPALNAGFNAYAKDYKYIGFLNDDDYWLPDFRRLINAVNSDSSLDFVYGKTYHIDQWGNIIKEQTCSNQFYHFRTLLQYHIILLTQQATLLKSEWFFKLGGFSEQFKLISDSIFLLDLSLKKPKYKYLNAICAAYAMQEGRLSSDKKLLYKEHQQLLLMLTSVRITECLYNTVIFRLTNWRIYIKNYFKYKTINIITKHK